jgi:type I restriction enzyme S subunit
MSFPRYPKYKDSGVEWLGQVPEHWEVKRLKHLALLTMGQSPNSDDCSQEASGLPFLQGNADFGYTSPFPRSYCSVATKVANCEDILFSVRAPVGAINIADQQYGIGRGLCAITTKPGHSMRFLFHALQVMKSELFSVATGSTYEAVTTDQVGNATCFAPDFAEQSLIASFLDQETAKIDALVCEQQRLIELLKEKRQAVISHAVTKGLNPKAPMKPSGNLWLGDVPAHWNVKRLKHVKADEKNAFVDGPFGSNLKSEHFIDDGDVYVIESGFATQGKLEIDELKTITISHFNTISRSETRPGDIIIAKIGAQYGKSSILPNLDKQAVVSGNSLKLTINLQSCEVKFVNWHLTNLKALGVIDDIVNGTAQPALSLGEMNNLPMLVPPRDEQIAIVEYLKTALAKLDTLTTEAQCAIDLLQERRTALISAAVTGQIDVR